MEEKKGIETLEKEIMDWRKKKRDFTARVAEHKEARQNLRDITDYEHLLYEEMLMDLFTRIEELERCLLGPGDTETAPVKE
jgi:hypothetical protein